MKTTVKDVSPDSWVDDYGDALFSYAHFRTGDTSIAEELVQDTFVAALSAIDTFQGRSSLKTWLFSILKNKITDQLRRKYRERSSPFESYSEHYLDDFFDPKGEWLTYPEKWKKLPQQEFEQREFMEVLRNCLQDLSEKQRDAFQLRELEENESDEICKVLRISSTNYWVLMHRARLVIRKCLELNW